MTSQAYKGIAQGLNEAIAFAGGKRRGFAVHNFPVAPTEVREARERLGLTQREFAENLLGVSVFTLRKWEQGQRQPTGAARTLIRVIRSNPGAVRKVLADTAA
jgi:putative transcriptional regulator